MNNVKNAMVYFFPALSFPCCNVANGRQLVNCMWGALINWEEVPFIM